MTLVKGLCEKGDRPLSRVCYDGGEWWKGDVVLERRVYCCLRQDWNRCPYAKKEMAVLPDISEYVITCQHDRKGSQYWTKT